jgi:DNA-directed RNA polymerase subunit M/transcription elongation factor TFIIS
MPLSRQLIVSTMAGSIKDLLVQCCTPNATTGELSLNLYSSREQNPLSTILSPADELAEIWTNSLAAGNFGLLEESTKKALERLRSSGIPDPSNPSTSIPFSVKRIVVSPRLNVSYIPRCITNLEGLQNFICSGNDFLKELETSATELVDCSSCDSLISIKACSATEIQCSDCMELVEIESSEVTRIDDNPNFNDINIIRINSSETEAPATTIEPEESDRPAKKRRTESRQPR